MWFGNQEIMFFFLDFRKYLRQRKHLVNTSAILLYSCKSLDSYLQISNPKRKASIYIYISSAFL